MSGFITLVYLNVYFGPFSNPVRYNASMNLRGKPAGERCSAPREVKSTRGSSAPSNVVVLFQSFLIRLVGSSGEDGIIHRELARSG